MQLLFSVSDAWRNDEVSSELAAFALLHRGHCLLGRFSGVIFPHHFHEHVWVVLSRPTKYVPVVNAKAGETNARITATASTCFLILVSLGPNLPPDDGTPRKYIVWRATKSIYRNRTMGPDFGHLWSAL
jgi:hypothetical protein